MAALGAGACLLVSATSRAQCAIDNDCPGEQVCENGACAAPSVAAPQPATPPSVTPPPTAPQPAAPAAAPAQRWQQAAPPPVVLVSEQDDQPRKKGKRYSTAMMVGGIVMTSVSFVPLMLMGAGMIAGKPEFFVGGAAGVAVLAGVGIPLIAIGAKRQPIAEAQLAPWLTPQGGGLAFDLRL
jgi:hypothetical protein